ncbi:phage tail protein [Amycolatopsis sp. OK19-0408]|uniref:Phage tail protein n=1 Tax=Amycolatopsis iheyensis TaxID=2945988 RepID=A0A9X2NJB0_9PSEU|nr:phage tail protein [Amycolatopsis iheyensis]MCR6487820.1 phage tail protein [Amycolatopsis iheyensis]
MTTARHGGIPAPPVLSAPRFVVTCEGWTTGLGFSKLGSLQSEVEFQEYSYNSRVGNVHTKQFGRSKPPSIVLERALDSAGFAQLYGWHLLARMNNPLAKLPASFDILTKSGEPVLACLLENAWCQKLEVEQTQADASAVSMMKATIVCDGIVQL